MTKRFILTFVPLAAVLVLVGAGCYSKATTNTPVTNTSSTTTPTSSAVSIQGFAFSPSAISVAKGTQVTWTNNDSATHTITGSNGGPASGNVAPGGKYSFTFNTVGTFAYHCSIHPSMTGTVTVN